jgi:hypothetical protein
VLHLDPAHPVFEGVHQGPPDGSGHVELRRLDAPALRFEPASRISDARRLSDTLVWQGIQTDDEPYAWSNPQATKIAHVVGLLCGSTRTRTTAQETSLIVTTYLEASDAVEGYTTYGTPEQRYEAATELRPKLGANRYLIDENTGELVIRVSDLTAVARTVIGGGLERGWLDARMEDLGWARRTLDGRATAGREGRKDGGHAHPDVYRGHLPPPPPEAVDPPPGARDPVTPRFPPNAQERERPLDARAYSVGDYEGHGVTGVRK